MKKNIINDNEISVVVQGAIDKINTPKCLESIRKHLKGSTIILSTWQGSNLEGLDYDVLIDNEDPGAEIFDEVNILFNNVNRQILSTKTGLNAVKTKYVLKIRSDIELKNTNFLKYFQKYESRNTVCKILKERVIINSLYTRQKGRIKLLFHPSDWVFFGLNDDLKNIFDVPLAKEPENSKWFKTREKNVPSMFATWLYRYDPEQYIWVSFLKKNGIKFQFDNFFDYSEENNTLSELSIVNNLVVVDYEDFGIKFLKYDPYRCNIEYTSNLTHYLWLGLYKEYCNPTFKISSKNKNRNKKLLFFKKIFNWLKHYRKL